MLCLTAQLLITVMQIWQHYSNPQNYQESPSQYSVGDAHSFYLVPEIHQICTVFFNLLINKCMNKAEIERKKQLARSLYITGMEQTEIADQVGVSRVTISKWATAEGWKEARAAKSISRPELVNKLLLAIDNLIGQVNASGDPEAIGTLADKLSKLSATIEKLDKKANVVDALEVFMAFNRWIQDHASYDPDITPELIKAINKYQNKFLMEKMTPNSEL